MTLVMDAARSVDEFSYRAAGHARSRCPWRHGTARPSLGTARPSLVKTDSLEWETRLADTSTYVQDVPIDSSKIRRQSDPMALSHRMASCIF